MVKTIAYVRPKRVELHINSGKKTAAQIKAQTGCTHILNGGVYDFKSFKPYCHLKANGTIYAKDQYSYYGYGWNNADDIALVSDYSMYANYICCVCMAKDGKPEKMHYNADMGGVRGRSAIGLMPDGGLLLYCSKDGSNAAKSPEALQNEMLALGVQSAVMLDGGGSSQCNFNGVTITSSRIVQNLILVWEDNPIEEENSDNMKIIEEKYNWSGSFNTRSKTEFLILHHAAASNATAQDIHRWHLNNGWLGIGYNYYVRKDGSIYRGRPESAEGAHTSGYNSKSIGICAEGNFETDTMPTAQRDALKWLVADVLSRYPNLTIGGHKEYDATACPGKNYPLAELKNTKAADTSKTTTNSNTIYRVQLGAFTVKANAEALLDKVKKAGFTDAFIKADSE